MRLVTIPISHYCEKARWALDRAGLPYTEERHVQMVHRVHTRRAGGGNTAPVLVLDDGRALGESAQIVEFALGPASPEVAAFCADLDERFGPAGRLVMYTSVDGDREAIEAANFAGVPRWEHAVFSRLLPMANWMIKRVLGDSEDARARSRAICEDTMEHVAQRLSDGRRYLFGDAFGHADLTFAALAAALVSPPTYGVPLPQPDALPEPFASNVRAWREHPAGAFALRMFAEERAVIQVEPRAQPESRAPHTS